MPVVVSVERRRGIRARHQHRLRLYGQGFSVATSMNCARKVIVHSAFESVQWLFRHPQTHSGGFRLGFGNTMHGRGDFSRGFHKTMRGRGEFSHGFAMGKRGSAAVS